MKKAICTLAFLLYAVSGRTEPIDGAMKELSGKVINSYQNLPNAKYRNSVAVMDFQNASPLAEKNNLGFAFSEIFAEHLGRSGAGTGLRIIERKQLTSILKEKELKLTGIAEGESAAAYAEVLGANLILVGSVFEAGDSVRVNARMIETEKSR